MTNRIYLDHAATTPLRPEAKAAMEEGFALWANPSSPHADGRRARAALEDARERIKLALGWEGELIFTSGTSEALAIGLGRAKVAVSACSAVEHEAVLRRAGNAERWLVSPSGLVEVPQDFAGGLVAIQHANNETGVIQPLDAIYPKLRGLGGLLFCDCAQTAGKIALPGADMIAIAAHKFGGPIGIGALLVKDFAMLEPSGGQERGYRSGTENLPLALGMAAALEAGNGWMTDALKLRALLEERLVAAGAEVVAADAPRIATIGAYRMPGVSSSAQLIRFDAAGFAVSAGSACSSGTLRVSHVLEAMGYDHPGEIIRVSFGWNTKREEVERFCEAWIAMAREAAEKAA